MSRYLFFLAFLRDLCVLLFQCFFEQKLTKDTKKYHETRMSDLKLCKVLNYRNPHSCYSRLPHVNKPVLPESARC